MPIHDWSKIPSGLWHDYHQSWSVYIKNAMNHLLPKGMTAFVEQKSWPKEGDVLAIERKPYRGWNEGWKGNGDGGLATLAPPKSSIVHRTENHFYADKANRILVRHHLGRIVAVIELVSPGNKDTKRALRQFVEKIGQYLEEGIHVLVVDLFPPSKRDPQGIHKAIWDEVCEEEFVLPPGKDRTLVSYKTGIEKVAYVEPVALGAEMPDMPLYLFENFHIPVPLEAAYRETWDAYPEDMREIVETGVMPAADDDK